MNRKKVLLRLWEISNQTESWFAPVQKALENVDEAQAVWKPADITEFNSIQEITYHLLYYKARFLSSLTGSAFETLADNETTFIAGLSMDWEKIKRELYVTNFKIVEYLQTLQDSDLDSLLPKETIGQQVMDLAAHDAYHAGQIVLIRKLQGAW